MRWNQSKWALYSKGVLLVWLALMVIDLLLLYITPREYLGRIRIQVLPNSSSFEVFTANSIIPPHNEATFVADQIQTITSKQTLYRVIEQLQLVKKWEDAKSPSDAYQMLFNKVETEQIPGTSMVDVEIYHTDPQEAADLANAIFQAYQSRRNEIETSRSNNALDMLNAQETLQAQKVEDARLRMIQLMEKFDIADFSSQSAIPPSADSPETATQQSLIEALASYHRRMREVSDSRTRLDAVLALPGDRRTDWFLQQELLPAHARTTLEEIHRAQGQQSAMRASGLDDDDPASAALQDVIDSKWEIVRSAVNGTTSLLKTEDEIMAKSLQNYADMVERLSDDLLKERKSYVQYTEAKRAFDMQSELLSDVRKALLQQKIDLSLPKSPIIVHEIAEANEIPVRPRVPLEIATSAGINLLWALPGSLIVLYLSLVSSSKRDRQIVQADDVPEAVEVDHKEPPADRSDSEGSW